MNKQRINNILRRFGVELHGLGYLEKIQKNSFRNDPFEAQLRFIHSGQAKMIVDAGANNGGVSEKYSRLFPSAAVHAFEPIPEMMELFRQRNQSNPRIHLNGLALSDQNGEVTFHINKSADTSSILESDRIGSSSDALCQTVRDIQVQTMTLDDYCASKKIGRIDILKMDTQGSELNILKGARGLLGDNRIGLIFSEIYFKPQYKGQPLFDELLSFLRPYGFELQDIYETQYNQRQLLWGDAIFIHRDLKG